MFEQTWGHKWGQKSVAPATTSGRIQCGPRIPSGQLPLGHPRFKKIKIEFEFETFPILVVGFLKCNVQCGEPLGILPLDLEEAMNSGEI